MLQIDEERADAAQLTGPNSIGKCIELPEYVGMSPDEQPIGDSLCGAELRNGGGSIVKSQPWPIFRLQ